MGKRKTKRKKTKAVIKRAKPEMIENYESNYQEELKKRRIEESERIANLKPEERKSSEYGKRQREIKELQKKFSVKSYDKLGGEYKK